MNAVIRHVLILALGATSSMVVSCAAPIAEQVPNATLEQLRNREFQEQLCEAAPGSLDPLFSRLATCDSETDLGFEVAQSIRLVVGHEYRRHVPDASLGTTYKSSPIIGPWIDPVPLQTWWSVNRERVLAGQPFELPPGLYNTQGMSFAESLEYMSGSTEARVGEAFVQLGYVGE